MKLRKSRPASASAVHHPYVSLRGRCGLALHPPIYVSEVVVGMGMEIQIPPRGEWPQSLSSAGAQPESAAAAARTPLNPGVTIREGHHSERGAGYAAQAPARFRYGSKFKTCNCNR